MSLKAASGWVAGMLGAVTAVLAFWGTYGWVTNQRYTSDHVDAPTAQQILQAVEETKQASADYHRHWECDEAFEEIVELREEGQAGALDQSDAFKLEQLVRRFERLECDQFDTD